MTAVAPISPLSRSPSQQALQKFHGICWLSWDYMPISGPITTAKEMQFSDWLGLSHMFTSATWVGMNMQLKLSKQDV